MKIVIDMQGAQSENKNRGIGRYTLSIVKEMICQAPEHEFILALNGCFSDSVEYIRAYFEGVLPQKKICVWNAPGPTNYLDQENAVRRKTAVLVYEYFLASHDPDFIYVTSLFEGLSSGAVTSIHYFQKKIPVAVTLYDLIPYINQTPYLENDLVKSWYFEKIDNLRRADLWLGISESSRCEGINHLNFSEDRSINISTDADEKFRPIEILPLQEKDLRFRYNLKKHFVMYTGGIDHRKNVETLVRAYAQLPIHVREHHQLAIVCSIQKSNQEALESLAQQHGLQPNEFVLTGYIPDDDLLALYNLCKLFVFPSWHEGFGLPALEAMRCGAPVIGANTSSLPEVIGLDEALFDPYSDESVSKAILRGLIDEDFRTLLVHHGKKQARRFSWTESARRALKSMEKLHQQRTVANKSSISTKTRSKLAFFSPLPPAKSGIADYSFDLLPELVKFYDIEIIVDQVEEIKNICAPANFVVRDVKWFIQNLNKYNRVIYHFGNSSFHKYMFELLEKKPGIVILHDFYLSGIQAHRDIHGNAPYAWARALQQSHGYKAVVERYTADDTATVVWHYPANLPVLQRALGVIVHGEHSRLLAQSWYGNHTNFNWPIIPLLRKRMEVKNREEVRRAIGLQPNDLLVCSFGMLGPTKLNHRLLQSWLNSSLANNPSAYLVFVGENSPGDYGKSLLNTIKNSTARDRIKITGWADVDTFHSYLAAADIGVQLRTLSRGETSASVLDCMNYGLATIINGHGSMADLDRSCVWMLADDFSDADLSEALTSLAQNGGQRSRLGISAKNVIHTLHDPVECAKLYFKSIEEIYEGAENGLLGLCNHLTCIDISESEITPLAIDVAANFPPRPRRRQLLIDISELVQRDAKSGIQRVVRAILKELLDNPPQDWQIEPVYATTESIGYRYARKFVSKFMNIPSEWAQDDVVELWPEDMFLGLDLQPHVVMVQEPIFKKWYGLGVKIWFVIYDLLPIVSPQFFIDEGEELHKSWMRVVNQFDGLICISDSVVRDARAWLSLCPIERHRPLSVKWFHLGADISSSTPSLGVPINASEILKAIHACPSFLMVGTIEPRKGHSQVLDAFDKLWHSGFNVNLVVVGKKGWMVEDLVDTLRQHPLVGKHLFLLEGISDEYLEKIYAASSCLIAASYGEGFGLPLIEAAQHKIPIVARDIPVFREVAGAHAYYFKANDGHELAAAIQAWLELYQKGQHPKSDHMSWLTWKESAQQLLKALNIIPNNAFDHQQGLTS